MRMIPGIYKDLNYDFNHMCADNLILVTFATRKDSKKCHPVFSHLLYLDWSET